MQTALLCLEVVAKLNQVAFDGRAVAREYGLGEQEVDPSELLRILKHQGFKAKKKRLALEKLERYPLPAIYQEKEGRYGVLLKLNLAERKLLLFSTQDRQAHEKSFEEFERLSTGELLIVKHKLLSQQVKFGFQWFFAEILNYRRVIGEVLVEFFCDPTFWFDYTTFYASNFR